LKPASPYLSIQLASEVMTVHALKLLLPDPLLGSWLTSKLFPIFTDGQAIINNLLIQGSLKEISHMGKPENRDSLSLDLTLTDTDITLEKPGSVFTNSSAHLEIKKGKLKVSNIQGSMAETKISRGSYQIDNIYDPEKTSRFGGNLSTSLAGLRKLSSIAFMPEKLQKDSQVLDNYSGHFQATIQAHFKPSYKTIRFDRFEATISDMKSLSLYQGSPLTFGKITIARDAHSKNVLVGSARWQETEFHLSGFFRDDATGSVTIQSSLDLPVLLSFAQKSSIPLGSTDNGQTLPVEVTIHKKDDKFLLESHVTLPKLSMISRTDTHQPFTSGELKLNLTTGDWRQLKINNFTVGYNNYLLKGTGSVNLNKMKMKLNIKNPESISTPASRLLADLTVDINLDQPDSSELFGSLQGYGLTFPLPGLASPAVNAGFKISFSGRRVDIHNFDFFLEHNLDGTPLHVHGYLEKDNQLKGVLLVDGEYININDIFTSDAETRQQEAETIEEHDLSGEKGIIISARIHKFGLNNTLISPLFLQGYLEHHRFYLTKLAASSENGQLGIKTTPDQNKENNLTCGFFLKKQNLEELDQFLPDSDNRDIKGHLSLGGIIHARGNSFEKLRSRLKGDISFQIQDATLKGDYILVRLLELLSIENLFSKKADYAEEGDLYIKSMTGNLSLEDSILTSKDIFIDTIAFNGSGDFKIDLQTRNIKSHLALSPFGTVDTIISTIPIVGHILTGKDKSLVSYHFRITGSLENPEISYIPLTKIPTSLIEYGKRLFSPSTYLFWSKESKKGFDYEKFSLQLVTEIEQSFETNYDLLKDEMDEQEQ